MDHWSCLRNCDETVHIYQNLFMVILGGNRDLFVSGGENNTTQLGNVFTAALHRRSSRVDTRSFAQTIKARYHPGLGAGGYGSPNSAHGLSVSFHTADCNGFEKRANHVKVEIERRAHPTNLTRVTRETLGEPHRISVVPPSF